MVNAVIIEGVKEYATKHYDDGGWDVVIECFDDDELEELIGEEATTVDEAVASLEDVVSVWAERQADARNSAF